VGVTLARAAVAGFGLLLVLAGAAIAIATGPAGLVPAALTFGFLVRHFFGDAALASPLVGAPAVECFATFRPRTGGAFDVLEGVPNLAHRERDIVVVTVVNDPCGKLHRCDAVAILHCPKCAFDGRG